MQNRKSFYCFIVAKDYFQQYIKNKINYTNTNTNTN